MTLLEEQISHYLQQQEAAKRVLLVIKKHRRKKGEGQEMPPIPSALLTAEETEELEEEHSFYVYRTDTNAVLARGIQGFEAAKERANQLRKSHGLKWDQVSFRSEKKPVAPIKKNTTFMKSPFIKYGSGYADQNGGGSKIRTTYKDFDE